MKESRMLLDDFLPEFDVRTSYATRIAASPTGMEPLSPKSPSCRINGLSAAAAASVISLTYRTKSR
jgi:hypothetical protein